MRYVHNSARPSEDKSDLLVAVAKEFYVEGRSQGEIARRLRLDPSTISRYLKRARREGIVRIEIARPSSIDLELALRLSARFGLGRAVVAPSRPEVAAVAADYIDGVVRDGLRLGLSWGRTLAAVVRYLTPGLASGLTIAQLAGGLSEVTPGVHGHELVQFVAGLYPDSRVHYLHAPVIVDSVAIKHAMVNASAINASLIAATKSEVALVGIGAVDEEATLARGGHVSARDLDDLLAHGAVGSMNARFFDITGSSVPVVDDRTIAISWDDLRAIPSVVAVAAGDPKVEAIIGALHTRCLDVLITDQRTARALLTTSGPSQEEPMKRTTQ
jgi:DNA-binding transcriptional regulator LsrR (DeoR family)